MLRMGANDCCILTAVVSLAKDVSLGSTCTHVDIVTVILTLASAASDSNSCFVHALWISLCAVTLLIRIKLPVYVVRMDVVCTHAVRISCVQGLLTLPTTSQSNGFESPVQLVCIVHPCNSHII